MSTNAEFNDAQIVGVQELKEGQWVLVRQIVEGQDEPTIHMGTAVHDGGAFIQNRVVVRLLNDDEIVNVHIDNVRMIDRPGPRSPNIFDVFDEFFSREKVEARRKEKEPVKVDPRDAEYRQRAILFNDITHAPDVNWMPLSQREAIANYLHEQGWRRPEKPEDIT